MPVDLSLLVVLPNGTESRLNVPANVSVRFLLRKLRGLLYPAPQDPAFPTAATSQSTSIAGSIFPDLLVERERLAAYKSTDAASLLFSSSSSTSSVPAAGYTLSFRNRVIYPGEKFVTITEGDSVVRTVNVNDPLIDATGLRDDDSILVSESLSPADLVLDVDDLPALAGAYPASFLNTLRTKINGATSAGDRIPSASEISATIRPYLDRLRRSRGELVVERSDPDEPDVSGDGDGGDGSDGSGSSPAVRAGVLSSTGGSGFAELFRSSRIESIPLPEVSEDIIAPLLEMGFTRERAVKALLLNRLRVEEATNFLLEHSEDADMDDPLTEDQRRLIHSRHGSSTGRGSGVGGSGRERILANLEERFNLHILQDLIAQPSVVSVMENEDDASGLRTFIRQLRQDGNRGPPEGASPAVRMDVLGLLQLISSRMNAEPGPPRSSSNTGGDEEEWESYE